MVERGTGMSVDSSLHVNKRIHPALFLKQGSLRIFTGKRKLAFPGRLFIPDKGDWPDLHRPPRAGYLRHILILGSLRSDSKPRLEILGTVRRRPGPRGCSCNGVDLRIEPWSVWEPGSGECSGAGIGNGVPPMIGNDRRLSWRSIPAASRSARVRRTSTAPAVESLEGRQLLSTFTGFTHVRNILTPAGIFSLQVTGPGVLKASPAGHGAINLNVLGTTTNSSLSITQVQPRFHVVNTFLVIHNLTIKSGQIGNIQASPAELDGRMTLPMTPPAHVDQHAPVRRPGSERPDRRQWQRWFDECSE